jgi:cytochrome o ubiquinol oxidase subunit 1
MVWLHHFFTMGAGADVNAFFGIMTAVIAVPTGVKIFNWLFTMYRGRIRFTTPMLWFIGFVVLFTLGGVTGVMLAEPPTDYQLHNSLFLVAHFHTMIVSGVLFGYFAGLTYWFPMLFGFTLDERWGRRAFWCWLVGFILAFGPLYILGFMGATRRLDHYSANLGWQPLFIVAGVGVLIIALGFVSQLLQIIVSIKNRKANKVVSDPWDARTLEWSTPIPVPSYNFAVLPEVDSRDQFWVMKQKKVSPKKIYEDISMPKNSAAAIYIAASIFFCGFGVVWHIWWLALLGFLAALASVIVRVFDEDTEHLLSAAEIKRQEKTI